MKSVLLPIFAIAFVFICSSGAAQTQADLNEQSAREFKQADEALNDTYKKLVAKLDKQGKEKLQEAQRAWIKFRDLESESRADGYRGGSIMPLIYNNCQRDLTNARTKDLEDRLKELEDR